jgi:hypothetical protein
LGVNNAAKKEEEKSKATINVFIMTIHYNLKNLWFCRARGQRT